MHSPRTAPSAGHGYADDAGAIYEALLQYATSVLSAFYGGPADLAGDKQLQVGFKEWGWAPTLEHVQMARLLVHAACAGLHHPSWLLPMCSAGLPVGPGPWRARRHPWLPRCWNRHLGCGAG